MSRLAFTLIFGLFLATPSVLAAGAPITPERVSGMLVNPHGAPWHSLMSGPAGGEPIRVILKEFIERPLSLERLKLRAPVAQVQNRAIAEFGKFSVNAAGELRADAREIYQRILLDEVRTPEDSRRRLAALEGLMNAASPEAVSLLLTGVSGRFDSSLDTVTVQMLERVFDSTPLTDPGLYQPNLGKPLAERPRPAEWRETAGTARARLEHWRRTEGIGEHEWSLLTRVQSVIHDFVSGKRAQAAVESEPSPIHPALAPHSADDTRSELDSQEIPVTRPDTRALSGGSEESSRPASPHWTLWLLPAALFFLGWRARRHRP